MDGNAVASLGDLCENIHMQWVIYLYIYIFMYIQIYTVDACNDQVLTVLN